jgi:hypothetical protein
MGLGDRGGFRPLQAIAALAGERLLLTDSSVRVAQTGQAERVRTGRLRRSRPSLNAVLRTNRLESPMGKLKRTGPN